MKKYEEPIISVKSLNHSESLMLTGSVNQTSTDGDNVVGTNQQQPANWNNWSK